MKMLEQVRTGRRPAPRRVLLYGTQGVGKSTFAGCALKPVFIQTEDGLGEIDCDKFPLATRFDQVMKSLEALYTDEHSYRTIVVDSLDWLERLIWEEVCQEKAVGSIEDIGYAKGYVFSLTHWKTFLEGLSALRSDKGMTVVLIAHARIERFDNPETDPYDRYTPRLHRLASQMIMEWCDEVLFASYKVHTKQTKEGFDRTRTQGIGTGERIIRTVERPAHVAKNRLNLPDELPLDWSAYAHYITDEKTKGGN